MWGVLGWWGCILCAHRRQQHTHVRDTDAADIVKDLLVGALAEFSQRTIIVVAVVSGDRVQVGQHVLCDQVLDQAGRGHLCVNNPSKTYLTKACHVSWFAVLLCVGRTNCEARQHDGEKKWCTKRAHDARDL